MLFEPIKLGDMEIKNRVVMPPLCSYVAFNGDGKATEFHLQHYLSRAIGGVGLIVQEATAIMPQGRITKHDLGIWTDEQAQSLKPMVKAVQQTGSKIIIQLSHAGRKTEVPEGKFWAASAIPFSSQHKTPTEMSLEDIKEAQEAFVLATKRALNITGYDGIELHAAHGYLINTFLSPASNKRTDEYGGSVENRVRFLKEILENIRSFYPKDKLLVVRVSAEEYVPEGNHPEDMLELLQPIIHLIDVVHISSGGNVSSQKIEDYPLYQVDFSKIIKEKLGCPTIAVGKITTIKEAEYILRTQAADMVAFGRELLRNPFFFAQHNPDLVENYPSYKRSFAEQD